MANNSHLKNLGDDLDDYFQETSNIHDTPYQIFAE
jgi:hypothetical protein